LPAFAANPGTVCAHCTIDWQQLAVEVETLCVC
jgi:hypothetical protein